MKVRDLIPMFDTHTYYQLVLEGNEIELTEPTDDFLRMLNETFLNDDVSKFYDCEVKCFHLVKMNSKVGKVMGLRIEVIPE